MRVLETTPHPKKPLLIKNRLQIQHQLYAHFAYCPPAFPHLRRTRIQASVSGFLNGSGTTSARPPAHPSRTNRLSGAYRRSSASVRVAVHLQYVPGRAGIEGNEGVDVLANYGATVEPLEERDWDALITELADDVPEEVSILLIRRSCADCLSPAGGSAQSRGTNLTGGPGGMCANLHLGRLKAC